MCSALCCCDVSSSHCLFRCILAGVAVKLTSLATTEHCVHKQACWAKRVRIGKCDSQSLPGGRWRVTTNVMVRDLDLDDPRAADARRLEVVVDGSPLCGGCQLAVDATVVSALHCDGSPHRGAVDGVVLHRARRRKERTYPELWGLEGGPRFVVLGIEVGGRMSTETASFLSQLAKARARQETALMRRRAEQAWRMRWGSILACATARQSPHLCSVWARRMTRMVTHLQRMWWKGPWVCWFCPVRFCDDRDLV